MDSGNNEDEITTTTTDNTAATATNNKKKHDSDANKCFILDYVVDDDVLLPFEFYSDLSVGIYIALKFVRIRDVFHFWGNHKKKSGYYEYGLLVYCKNENRFTQLLPCYYTVKKMQKLYRSSFLRNDDNVVILEKKSPKKKECVVLHILNGRKINCRITLTNLRSSMYMMFLVLKMTEQVKLTKWLGNLQRSF